MTHSNVSHVATFLVPFSEVAFFLVPLLGLDLWAIRWGGAEMKKGAKTGLKIQFYKTSHFRCL